MEINAAYLESVKKQFQYYKMLGEKAMAQLEERQLFTMANEDTNSIATIVKHLSGNMCSRWTAFLTTDGEKDWRNRDAEFDNDLQSKAKVLEVWDKGWKCFFDALNGLQPEQLSQLIYIRNEGHTVVEAVNRQLAHYPYHIGQIVFQAKQLKTSNWETLSIAKKASKNYNAEKFSQEKRIRNFTDDELKRLKR